MNKNASRARPLDAVAAVLLVLETLYVAFLATAYGLYAVQEVSSRRLYTGVAVVGALLAIGVAAVTWGWVRRRRFATSAALSWQLLQLSLGVWVLGASPLAGLVMIGAAIVVAVAALKRHAALARAASESA